MYMHTLCIPDVYIGSPRTPLKIVRSEALADDWSKCLIDGVRMGKSSFRLIFLWGARGDFEIIELSNYRIQ